MPIWRLKFAKLGLLPVRGAELFRTSPRLQHVLGWNMFKVIVDADACPKGCLQILRRHKKSWNYRLLTVASVDHQIDSKDHIVVGKGSDSADLAVINNTARGDIVVTQDWGLAALILGKGASALSPSGRIYSNQAIDFLLEERSLKAKHRRGGGRTKGPSARTGEDDQRFEKSLVMLLERATNQAHSNKYDSSEH